MKKALVKTDSDGNFVKLSCMNVYNIPEYNYFPTYNGIDPLTEIECTKNGWSLPVDMKPLYCAHVFCPPIIDVGEEVDVECTRRDETCRTSKPYTEDINDERYQDCECEIAEYSCKKEGSNYPMIGKSARYIIVGAKDFNRNKFQKKMNFSRYKPQYQTEAQA